MIRVTIWTESVQERWDTKEFDFTREWLSTEEAKAHARENARLIHEANNGGYIHDTLKGLLEEEEEIVVKHIGHVDDPECGLTEEVLDDTDVLLWWAHVAHEQVPYEIALRVRDHVWKGMGIIFLHSAHMSRPMQLLLGTSCTLRWREDDSCRLWKVNPNHPIAQGLPDYIELSPEEMYGELFDIPTPDEIVFMSWFKGGEVFRSGCTWTRGRGKVFYFQPGHETNRAYQNVHIRRIIRNAAKWAANFESKIEKIECIHATDIPEKH